MYKVCCIIIIIFPWAMGGQFPITKWTTVQCGVCLIISLISSNCKALTAYTLIALYSIHVLPADCIKGKKIEVWRSTAQLSVVHQLAAKPRPLPQILQSGLDIHNPPSSCNKKTHNNVDKPCTLVSAIKPFWKFFISHVHQKACSNKTIHFVMIINRLSLISSSI